jgi:ADP-ribose pyrophosphatase YjhB (NUDIX family)
MYEVFINHHSLVISNYQEKEMDYLFHFEELLSWSQLFTHLNNRNPLKFCVYANNCDLIWASFKSNFEIIKAAGGLVVNNQRVLMIFRNGKWDLPKGKQEVGESIDVCAKREVQEECGLNDLEIADKLMNTYHTYEHKGQSILKETHWYLMTSSQSDGMSPQIEEGIEKVSWASKEDVNIHLENTHENIKRVFEKYYSLK